MTNPAGITPQPLRIDHANWCIFHMKDLTFFISHMIDQPLVFRIRHQINYHWINHKIKLVFVDNLTWWTNNLFGNSFMQLVHITLPFGAKRGTTRRYLLFLMQYLTTQTFTNRVIQNDQTKPIFIIFMHFICSHSIQDWSNVVKHLYCLSFIFLKLLMLNLKDTTNLLQLFIFSNVKHAY